MNDNLILPVLYGAPWLWTCDSAPATNVSTDNGYINQYNFWIDTTTSNWWICVDGGDNQNSGLVWEFLFTQPISRDYQNVSLSFGTSRQPNITQNITVIASIGLTSTLLIPATVDIQLDTGSGFSTFSQLSISGVAADTIQMATFTVPPGASYKFVQSSGTSSIISIKEMIQ